MVLLYKLLPILYLPTDWDSYCISVWGKDIGGLLGSLPSKRNSIEYLVIVNVSVKIYTQE